MKSFALAALVAVTAAQETTEAADFYGAGCKADPTICDTTGETCVQWFDSEDYPRFTCQDCVGTGRTLQDEYQNVISYFCPGEEMGASSLYASAAALAATVAMMY